MTQPDITRELDELEIRFAKLDDAYAIEKAGYALAKERHDLGAMVRCNERCTEIGAQRYSMMPRFMWLMAAKDPK
jgi:hypothetical protein